MKSINKIFVAGAVALSLGFGATSCVDDLNVTPEYPTAKTWEDVMNDPDQYLPQAFSKCYSCLAVSGQSGEGSTDLSGVDAGKSNYLRAMFQLNEKTTDECAWIWTEDGIENMVRGTWNSGNSYIYGAYSRLYVNIAICNDFLRQLAQTGVDMQAQKTAYNCAAQYALEVRAIRALLYWNVLDNFGNGGWVDETVDYGTPAEPILRADLYEKLVAELQDIIAKWPAENADHVAYGRVGLDGVKMLLAKVYLNAEVYTKGAKTAYNECAALCNEIVANHQGGGFQGSGLANHYLALFAGNNDRYAPGGSAAAENEILWNVPFDGIYVQSYGGSRYLIAAAVINANMADNGYTMSCNDYGLNDQWGCMHARQQFSEKFDNAGNDVRDDFWSKDAEGFKKENTEYSAFNNGYAAIKFTNLNTKDDGTFYLKDATKGTVISNIADESKPYNASGQFEVHPNTDVPIFRLADTYLMLAECYLRGANNVTAADALKYVNYVRERAGAAAWPSSMLTYDNLLDERARELYWELHRRSDLVRYDKFVSGYNWAWKGYVLEGTDLNPNFTVFPIPANVIAAQPEFAAIQNPGY